MPRTGRNDRKKKICPGCRESANTVKYGIRHTSKGSVQKYHCTYCGIYFSDTSRPKTQYSEKLILYAVEQYNKGHTVKEVKNMTGKRFRRSPPTRTIYSWIQRYEDELSFIRLRKRYDLDPDDLTTTHRFRHLQVYPFTYHRLKMHLSAKDFPQLRRYISWARRA